MVLKGYLKAPLRGHKMVFGFSAVCNFHSATYRAHCQVSVGLQSAVIIFGFSCFAEHSVSHSPTAVPRQTTKRAFEKFARSIAL